MQQLKAANPEWMTMYLGSCVLHKYGLPRAFDSSTVGCSGMGVDKCLSIVKAAQCVAGMQFCLMPELQLLLLNNCVGCVMT
jgi:hypothetical protein